MTPITLMSFIADEGYGIYQRPKPDEYTIVMPVNSRWATAYRNSAGAWIMSWWHHRSKAMGHFRLDSCDMDTIYRDTCRWIFQGLRP